MCEGAAVTPDPAVSQDERHPPVQNVNKKGDPVTGTDKDELIRQLQYLRKGVGITLARVARCPEVLRVCGTTHPDHALARIEATIDTLRNRRSAQALRAAYALDDLDPLPRLADRRARYANRRSTDTVENWENQGIEELRLLLLAQQPAIQPSGDTGGIPIGGYAMERLEAVYRYTNGCFTESVQTRDVIALVDNADGFIYATHIDTQLTVIRGGTPTVLDRSPDGWVRHKIMFPKPLARGESHEFVLRETLVVPETQRPDPDKISQIFHIPTRTFWVTAEFSGDVPPLIWSFDKLTHFERPGHPTPTNRLHPHHNRVTKEFNTLYGGLFSGIAWQWNHGELPHVE
jgi:hypothetical protein